VSDITELERRITAALTRIDAGVDGMAQAPAAEDAGEIAALKEALEVEKTASAQLEERVAAIKEKQETLIKDLEAKIADLTSTVAQQETDAKRLLMVNAQLRESNDELRVSNESGVGDAHLVNKAMQTELEALRATRKADLAELETIMDELKPLIGEGA